jgi:3-deoxy-D-manno-octulosonic-acid transferase
MRVFYSGLFYFLIPFIIFRLLWRSLKAPDYRQRWRERFAFYAKQYPDNVIWFHAVSVGEAEALFPLVRGFQDKLPDVKILITTTTPTGSARVRAVMGQSVEHVYLPYDLPDAVGRFFRCFKPQLAVIIETEIWPNLFAYCGDHSIPLYLINARLSEKSARGYQKIPSLIQPILANVKHILSQSEQDTERFIAIGAKKFQVCTIGNIKFDVEIPETTLSEGKALKSSLFKKRFVCLAASTHKGEEHMFVEIYKVLKLRIPELLLVIVPRHPERFKEVGKECEQSGLNVTTRTSNQDCTLATDIYLADTMGELKMFYASADIAFVGGSMVNAGGHNPLEAAAIGVPVVFGPYMANFKQIADKIVAQNAAIQCTDQEELTKVIQNLYSDVSYRKLLIENGKLFVQANRGFTKKLCEMLMQAL